MAPRNAINAALALLGALWLLLLLLFPVSHNDTWWHVKCGEWLWEQRAFPAQDPFSYTGAAWLKASSLFNLLAFGAWSWGGAWGLVALKLACALGAALAAAFLALKRGAPLGLSLGALALAFLATRFQWTERPQAASAFCFALALLLMDAAPSAARLAGFFTLASLWANLNPSAVLLPGFALAWEFGRSREGGQAQWPAPLAALAGSLLNPQWAGAYLDVLGLYGGQAPMRQFVAEWKAPALLAQPWLLALFILLPWVLWAAFRSRRFAALALLGLTAAAAWKVGRMAPFFALAMGAWAPVLLKDALPGRLKAPAALALALGLLAQASWMLGRERLWTRMVDERQFPLKASAFLKANPPLGRLGNLYGDGAYLLFSLGPETKVFIDSREIIYPARVFSAALTLEAAAPAWRKVARDFDFSCVILPLRSRLAGPWLAEPGWKLAYFDADFVILAREDEWLAQAGRWPCYEGVDPLGMRLLKPSRSALGALERRLATQDPDAQGLYLLGLECAALGERRRAEAAFREGLKLDPGQDALREALKGVSGLSPR